MEDRYLFRGKRIDNGEWVQGYLYGIWEKRYILWGMTNDIPDMVEVDPSTICQCAGYRGTYEKDVFQCDDERYVIEWCDYSLCWEARAIGSSESISLGEFRPDEIVAIGNAIDNPELLEV